MTERYKVRDVNGNYATVEDRWGAVKEVRIPLGTSTPRELERKIGDYVNLDVTLGWVTEYRKDDY